MVLFDIWPCGARLALQSTAPMVQRLHLVCLTYLVQTSSVQPISCLISDPNDYGYSAVEIR